MIIIGIDPGKKGGIALMDGGNLVGAWQYTPARLSWLMEEIHVDLVAVEKVHSMPKQGVASTFAFGEGFGMIQGILFHAGYREDNGRLLLVEPQKWKRACGLIGCDKAASIALAYKLYPGVDFKPSRRSHKPSDGLAEAALIAKYGNERLEARKL